jgi:hypothetical protein
MAAEQMLQEPCIRLGHGAVQQAQQVMAAAAIAAAAAAAGLPGVVVGCVPRHA